MKLNEKISPGKKRDDRECVIFDGPVRFPAEMRRVRARLLGALFGTALLAALPSCLKQDRVDAPEAYVEYTACFHNESQDKVIVTRGAYSESELKLTDINLYIYDSRGDLYRQIFTDAIYTTKVRLALDSAYTILALANVGEVSPERRLEDMRAKTLLPWSGAAAMNGRGEPMAADMQFTAIKSTGLYVDLIRLVARYDMMLDQTDMVGKFTMKSLKLCQANDTLVPFVEDSPKTAASSVVSVADSATADDLAKLNTGERRSFHVSENRQGVLLPDNTDPWAKIPDNIPGKKDVCTYLEMHGDYHDDGITISDMGFRLYLGNDATTDFDIARNTAYTVTVSIADKATGKLSWKVVSGTTDDSRTLSWAKNPDTLYCEKTLNVTPTMNHPGTMLDFSVEDMDGLGVTYTRTGNTLKFSSSKQLPEVKKFYVTASTADGRHSAKLTVVVQPRYPVKLVADCAGYGGTGDWSWDFYKIPGGTVVGYTVTAIYNDGEKKILSTSDYSVSDNTRSDLVSFSTKGIVGCAGSTDTGGEGTVKFSYSENGKTVSLTKKWWKIYVTGISGDYQVRFGYPSNTGVPVSECILHYNDGSSETTAYPIATAGHLKEGIYTNLTVIKGTDCDRLVSSGYCATKSSIKSEYTYRGQYVVITAQPFSAGGFAFVTSGSLSEYQTHSVEGWTAASGKIVYAVLLDASGFSSVSNTIEMNRENYHATFSGGSVTGDQLLSTFDEWAKKLGAELRGATLYFNNEKAPALGGGHSGDAWILNPNY